MAVYSQKMLGSRVAVGIVGQLVVQCIKTPQIAPRNVGWHHFYQTAALHHGIVYAYVGYGLHGV